MFLKMHNKFNIHGTHLVIYSISCLESQLLNFTTLPLCSKWENNWMWSLIKKTKTFCVYVLFIKVKPQRGYIGLFFAHSSGCNYQHTI